MRATNPYSESAYDDKGPGVVLPPNWRALVKEELDRRARLRELQPAFGRFGARLPNAADRPTRFH